MTWGVHQQTAKKKRKGHKVSAATRKKISEKLKGKKHPHKGHKLSAATRAKISKALKGKHHRGHKMSAATKEKLRRRMKGRHLSAATRAKISKALKGKHHKAVHHKHLKKKAAAATGVPKKQSGPRRFQPPPLRHRVRTTRVTHGHRTQSTKATHGIRTRSTRTVPTPHVRYKPRKVMRHGKLSRHRDNARLHRTRRPPRQRRRRRRRR